MTLPIRALKAHLALNVTDVTCSVAFYRKLFGLEPARTRNGYAKFDMQNPPLNLSLNQSSGETKSAAVSHLGIQVSSTDDVLAIRQQWQDAGLAVRDEMGTNCCYALQDKVWVEDPDGNQWEAFVVLQDNLAETSACCSSQPSDETLVSID